MKNKKIKNEINILIVGDFFIKEELINENLIDDEVIDFFYNFDYRILNFEAPIISDHGFFPIKKTGPNLYMSKFAAILLKKKINIDLVTLANNHILDFGSEGLRNSFDELKLNNIDYVGAGLSLEEAEKQHVIQTGGFTISIVNFAENEWSNANVNKPGANPLNIISNIKQIKKAKENSDFVIVIIHGGHEYYQLPSPRMQEQYRFYAENGADAIIGHHTHCIGGYEIYKEVPILYSLGNFLFTLPSDKEVWYTGLVAKLNLSKGKRVTFELFPVQQDNKSFNVSLLKGEEKKNIFNKLIQLNKIIEDHTLLQKKWDEFVIERSKSYLQLLSPEIGRASCRERV